VAGLIAGLFILAGVGGFVAGLVSTLKQIRIDTTFEAGQTVAVPMSAGGKAGVFAGVSATRAGPDGTAEPVSTPVAQCAVTSPSGRDVPLSRPGGTFTATVDGVAWREIYVVHVSETGEHRVTCRSSEASRFATGKHPDNARLVGGLAGGIAALVLLPLVGLGIAITITIVVSLRRRDHRNRLIAERTGYPYPGRW
jgi:hypothetical protein